MRKLIILSLLFNSSFAPAQSGDSVFIRKIANEVFLHSSAYENLRTLTKKVGARLAGSPQMVQAELWGAAALKAAHADTVWLQECMVPHWIRGGKDEGSIAEGNFKNRKLNIAALGNSVGTGQPLQSPVIEIKSFDDLEKKKNQVKGKIVFYNYAFNPAYVKTFESYRDAVGYRSQGPARAARYGAKAVIIRSMSHATDNHPHTGGTTYNDSLPKIPAVAIGLQDADWLSTQLNKGPLSIILKTKGQFLPDTTGHNVIGEIKGAELPNEYITIGGHLDSWDLAEERTMMAPALCRQLKY